MPWEPDFDDPIQRTIDLVERTRAIETRRREAVLKGEPQFRFVDTMPKVIGRKAPKQKPHRSEQVVRTPRIFLDAVEKRFGKITLDVAALPENAVCERFFSPVEDGLSQRWVTPGLDWLVDGIVFCNPPFGQIKKWVAHAASQHPNTRIVMLVPSSTGSNWWWDYVHQIADVYLMKGRLRFVGHTTPFPKDTVALVYGGSEGVYVGWDWKNDEVRD